MIEEVPRDSDANVYGVGPKERDTADAPIFMSREEREARVARRFAEWAKEQVR